MNKNDIMVVHWTPTRKLNCIKSPIKNLRQRQRRYGYKINIKININERTNEQYKTTKQCLCHNKYSSTYYGGIILNITFRQRKADKKGHFGTYTRGTSINIKKYIRWEQRNHSLKCPHSWQSGLWLERRTTKPWEHCTSPQANYMEMVSVWHPVLSNRTPQKTHQIITKIM